MAEATIGMLQIELRATAEKFSAEIRKANSSIKSLERQFESTRAQIIVFNQGFELLGKGLHAASSAMHAFVNAMSRGQEVTRLTEAFNNLYGATGTLAIDGLGRLQTALDNTVDKITILKEANQAAQAGISPEGFVAVAEAADRLGDVVGKSIPEALADFTQAMTSGNVKSLQQYGIVVDLKKAQDDFAKSIGTTADMLNRTGQLEAARNAILAELYKNLERLGPASKTVFDSIEHIEVAWRDANNEILKAINENQELAILLDNISTIIKDTNWIKWASDLSKTLSVTVQVVEQLVKGLSDALAITVKFANVIPIIGPAIDSIARASQSLSLSVNDVFRQIPVIGPVVSGIASKVDDWVMGTVGVKIANEEISRVLVNVFGQTGKILSNSIKIRKEDNNRFIDQEKAAKAAQKALEKELALRKKISEEADKLTEQELKNAIERSIDELNQADFTRLRDELYRSVKEAYIKAHSDGITDPQLLAKIRENAERTAQIQSDEYTDKMGDAAQKVAEKQQDELEKRLQEAADFWTDVFADAINGEFDLDNLEDALKRAAAGFAGQLTASFVGAPTGVNSAQGFGQVLAQYFLSGSTGGVGWSGGGLWGGAAAGGVSSGISTGSAAGGAAGLGSASLAGFLGWLWPLAAIYGGMRAADKFQSYTADGDFTLQEGIKTTHPRGGVNFFNNLFGEDLNELLHIMPLLPILGSATFALPFIKGHGQGWQEGENRNAILEWLGENTGLGESETFAGVGGPITLDMNAYNVDSNSLAGQAVGLVQGLADVITGGDDKLGSDLAGIFANAVSAGEDFNDVMVNTLSLMDTLGFSAEDAKNQLTQLFLDGEVSLDEFAAGVQGLNVLATEDLIGDNSIKDAFDILMNSFKEEPRVAIKAMELLLQELSQAGITEFADMADYMQQVFGVDATALFEAMSQAGITSFEQFANLSADQLVLLFTALQELGAVLEDDIPASGEEAARGLGRQFRKMVEDAEQAAEDIKKAFEGAEKSHDPNLNIDGGYDSPRNEFRLPADMSDSGARVVYNIDARGAWPGAERDIARAIQSAQRSAVNQSVRAVSSERARMGVR